MGQSSLFGDDGYFAVYAGSAVRPGAPSTNTLVVLAVSGAQSPGPPVMGRTFSGETFSTVTIVSRWAGSVYAYCARWVTQFRA
jgi:hypothetical protein